jgi:hypothetical protein
LIEGRRRRARRLSRGYRSVADPRRIGNRFDLRIMTSQTGTPAIPASEEQMRDEHEIMASASERKVMQTARYRRRVRATRSRALEAVVSAVELLRYPCGEQDQEAWEVRFSALARTVIVKVVGATPEESTIVVEFASLRWLAIGGSALVIVPGVLLGAAVKAQDSYFARGFLDNVQRVLAGRGVGRDSARIPGMNALRERLELVDD